MESALSTRRSVRTFAEESLTLAEAAQLLWAAQGVTSETGKRTAPSAGALYPLEVLLVAAEVEGLRAGVYRYLPQDHALARVLEGDLRIYLSSAALGQGCIRSAPASIVIAGVYERASGKYGDRAPRYVHIEAGHAAQNVYLQAAVLGLGTVIVGAFADDAVRTTLQLRPTEQPLCIMPVGRPAR